MVEFNYPLKTTIQFLKYYFNKLLGGSGSPRKPMEVVLIIMPDKAIKYA